MPESMINRRTFAILPLVFFRRHCGTFELYWAYPLADGFKAIVHSFKARLYVHSFKAVNDGGSVRTEL